MIIRMIQIEYSAGIKKFFANTADRKGLREGHILHRWIESHETSHLPWQNIQHNKSLKLTNRSVFQTQASFDSHYHSNEADMVRSLVPPLC